MFPTKQDFDDLIEACGKDRSIRPNLEMSNLESAVRSTIYGLQEKKKNDFYEISQLRAYKWLAEENSAVYERASKRLFKQHETETDVERYLESKIDWVLRRSVHNDNFGGQLHNIDDRLFSAKIHLDAACRAMQLSGRWMAAVSVCLSRYHYREIIHTPAEYKKAVQNCAESLESALANMQTLNDYNVFRNFHGLDTSLPEKTEDSLNQTLRKLQHIYQKNLFPINRASDKFKERIFVMDLAKRHIYLFNRDPNKKRLFPAVIADLFYLGGFKEILDERSVQRICKDYCDILVGEESFFRNPSTNLKNDT